MNEQSAEQKINFTVDQKNLYREEGLTDMKVASIRCMVPVLPDGTDDKSRVNIYIGQTQLMSPEGPLPIQAVLPANDLKEAIAAFPQAMQTAMAKMVEELKKMQQSQQKKNDSRIIVP